MVGNGTNQRVIAVFLATLETFYRRRFMCITYSELIPQLPHQLQHQNNMEGIVDQIVNMGHGPMSVVVNCFQFSSMSGNDAARWIRARYGSRVVEASPESVVGLTQQPVHFSACSLCGAVSVTIGVPGDITSHMSLQPGDPRSRLLLSIITEAENHGQWSRDMNGPARVVRMIDVHGAAKMSETGSVCFNCP